MGIWNIRQFQDTREKRVRARQAPGPGNRSAGPRDFPTTLTTGNGGFQAASSKKRNRREGRSLSGAVRSVKATLVWSKVFPAS